MLKNTDDMQYRQLSMLEPDLECDAPLMVTPSQETVGPILTKVCRRCKGEKPREDFYKSSKSPDGLQCYCKQCQDTRKKSWVRDNPLKHLLVAVKSQVKTGKRSASEFTLTYAHLTTPSHCPALGIPLDWTGGRKGRFNTPSLDRIDNTKGYTPDNVVIVSERANRIKNDATVEELEMIVAFYKGLAMSETIHKGNE